MVRILRAWDIDLYTRAPFLARHIIALSLLPHELIICGEAQG